MKPLVAIVADAALDPDDARTGGVVKLNYNYADQVAKAGGNPLLLTPATDVEAIAPLLDGWLIPGGDDIDARFFGQEKHPAAKLVDPARFETEQRLYRVVDTDLPILGICYGCQFLGVMAGGSLNQHLPDDPDLADHGSGSLQEVAVDPDSRLAEILGTRRVEGKSYHHQALDRLGTGLAVVAHHPDGTIEAIESTERRWLFGVQWHPERTPEDAATQRLFRAFVDACSAFARQKRVGAAR